MGDFTGKTVVLTGARDIARAVTLDLAGSGARVVALGIDVAANKALAALTPDEALEVLTLEADVSDPEDFRIAFEKASALEAGIVNVSSAQGHACQSGVSAYFASKGAIHSMTRATALDFGCYHINFAKEDRANIDDSALLAFRKLAELHRRKTKADLKAELETGAKRPSRPALKLLSLVQKHGFQMLA